MAIIIDEEQQYKKSSFMRLLTWVGFIIIVIVAAYYIFFKAPDSVTITPTGAIGTIAPIAQSSFNPNEVTNSAVFQGLKSTITLPTPQGPAALGRPNPFIAP